MLATRATQAESAAGGLLTMTIDAQCARAPNQYPAETTPVVATEYNAHAGCLTAPNVAPHTTAYNALM